MADTQERTPADILQNGAMLNQKRQIVEKKVVLFSLRKFFFSSIN